MRCEALKALRTIDGRIAERLHTLFGYCRAGILFHFTFSDRMNVSDMGAAIEGTAKRPTLGTICPGPSTISVDGARPCAVRVLDNARLICALLLSLKPK